ncbi:MAG: response regulator [Planctomycetota bacterium]
MSGGNHRVLIIDDNDAIHEDFRKVLTSTTRGTSSAKAGFLGSAESKPLESLAFELESAYQGAEGFAKVKAALANHSPFAVAFVDMRMPPGWDGLETIGHLWKVDPDLQVVICTAYTDHSWEDIIQRLGQTDRLLLLKKPFDAMEVRQLASALSEKWRAHQESRRHVLELEQVLAKRTLDIQDATQELVEKNAALEKAKQAADAANRAKSEFLSNMSHEIRTPMTAILGFADTLFDPALTETERIQAIQVIQHNGAHLLTLIDDILDLSKIEYGRMEVERVPVSPMRLLAELQSLMSVRAGDKDITLQFEFGGEIPEAISTDPTRMKQVLINLVANAIKFSRENGVVRIITSTVNGTPAGPLMQFDIIDSGVGMTERQSEQLFKPFVQADLSTTRKYGGTGLGLTISKRLAELLGGDVVIVSTAPELGSHFRATIATGALAGVPMLESPAISAFATATAEAARSAELDAESKDLIGLRVLVADDVSANQRLLERMLKRAGADVMFVDNGQRAVDVALAAFASDTTYDVILMDVQMPVLDGHAATRMLRTRGYTGAIIALSAHAMASERALSIAAGCNDHETKPFNRQRLFATILRLARKTTPASS